MIYDELQDTVRMGTPEGDTAVNTFGHDGDSTGTVWLNGVLADSRNDLPVVAAFGAGIWQFRSGRAAEATRASWPS